MKKRAFTYIFCIFLIFLLSVTAFTSTNMLDRVSKTGKLRVGVCLKQPSFHFRDKQHQPAGLIIE